MEEGGMESDLSKRVRHKRRQIFWADTRHHVRHNQLHV